MSQLIPDSLIPPITGINPASVKIAYPPYISPLLRVKKKAADLVTEEKEMLQANKKYVPWVIAIVLLAIAVYYFKHN